MFFLFMNLNKDLEISSLQDNFNIKLKSIEDKYTHTINELQNNIKQLTENIEFFNLISHFRLFQHSLTNSKPVSKVSHE